MDWHCYLVEGLQVLLGKLCATRDLRPPQDSLVRLAALEASLRGDELLGPGRELSLLEEGREWEEESL